MRYQKTNNLRKIFLWLATFGLLSVVSFGAIISVDAYECRTGDTECEETRANMNEKTAEASALLAKANSLNSLINQLDQEISAINAEIAANEQTIAEVKAEIATKETQLEKSQIALAELIVKMHYDTPGDTVSILAGSDSISDLAERDTRQEALRTQIILASQKIKADKEALEVKKADVEQRLAANENSRALAESKRQTQAALRAEYRQSANNARTLANYYENMLKELAYVPPNNSVGWGVRNYAIANTYPERGSCPASNCSFYAHNGYVCQCTSYAVWKAEEYWGINLSDRSYNILGNAKYYAQQYKWNKYYVAKSGITPYVDQTPAAKTIAVDTNGQYGHVMWVESVNANGTINISEYNDNWPRGNCYIGDFCARNNVGSKGLYFVHFQKDS